MKIKELKECQLQVKLADAQTLKDFIKASGISEEATVTELNELLRSKEITSPFRELYITTEVTRSCGYTIAVTEEQYSRFIRGETSIDDLEPTRFNLEEAYHETEFGDNVASGHYDYAISDDYGRNIVEWAD